MTLRNALGRFARRSGPAEAPAQAGPAEAPAALALEPTSMEAVTGASEAPVQSPSEPAGTAPFGCPGCPATFQSFEAHRAHVRRHAHAQTRA